jgi:uroporphyrinogen decarboxylase
VDILGVDACIIFSDILVVPEAMGMTLVIEEGKGGPRFPEPIRSKSAIEKLQIPDPQEKLKYVMDAVALTRQRLNGRVPLIGFAGSPWTLAAYMVEGRGSRNFRSIKELVYSDPALAHVLLDKLAVATALYLNAKIAAGVQAVQIFDSWGGILPPDEFKEFSLGPIKKVLSLLHRNGVPVILFCKDCDHSLNEIAELGPDVIGLDWTTDLGKAREQIGSRVALQGNLDPIVLYAPPEIIRRNVVNLLEKFGHGPGHIFNLGHGILPDVPVEHAKAFVRAVQEESPRFHPS